MEIQAHYSALRGEVLRPCGVLDRIAAYQPRGLLLELIGAIPYSKQILVFGVPAYRGDVLSPALLCRESPNRQHRPIVVFLLVLRLILIVPIVMELRMISILDNHPLHDLETSLHRSTVQRVLLNLCLLLVRLLLLMPLVLLLLGLLLLEPLHVLLHVLVEDLPLGGLHGELGALGRVGLDAPLFEDVVEGLAASLLVVEGVTERGVLFVQLVLAL